MKQFIKIHFYEIAIILTISILFFAIASGAYFLNKKYYDQMEDSLVNGFFAPAQEIQTQYIANRMELQVESTISLLKNATEIPGLQDISSMCRPDQKLEIEKIQISLKDDVDFVSIVDKKGMMICHPTLSNLEGMDFSVYPHIQEALVSKKTVIGRLFANPLGIKLIAIEIPIFTKSGEFAGLINSGIYLEGMKNKLITDYKFTPTAYNALVDDDGMILYHPVPDFIGENVFGEKIQKETDSNTGLNNMFEKMISGKTGYDFYSFGGAEKVAGYAPVKLIDGNRFWSVAVTANVKEYSHITNPFIMKILLVNLFSVLGAFILIILAVYSEYIYERERERE